MVLNHAGLLNGFCEMKTAGKKKEGNQRSLLLCGTHSEVFTAKTFCYQYTPSAGNVKGKTL